LPPISASAPASGSAPVSATVPTEKLKNLETKTETETEFNEKSRRKPSVARVGGNLQVLANFTQYCPPSHARTLFWNWTKAVSCSKIFFAYVFL
jgi:hypothetical protein